MYERARAREQERVIGNGRVQGRCGEEGDLDEKEKKREREDRKRNRRSLAVRIISLFRALSFVESTWQYHCLSIKLKSLTPEYYSVKYPDWLRPTGIPSCRSVRFRTSVHRRRTGSGYAIVHTRCINI